MDFATAAMALKILSQKNNIPLAQGVAAGDKSAVKTVLDMLNLGNVTPDDYDQVIGLGRLFGKDSGIPSSPNMAPDIDKTKLMNDIPIIRNALAGGTAGKVAQLALLGVDAIGHGTAKIAENNGNRLAQAILAAGRTNSARQNEIYGPSLREKAAELSAQEKLRKAGNVAAVGNTIGDLAGNLAGIQRSASNIAGNMALMRQVPLSSAALDYYGRNVSALKGK